MKNFPEIKKNFGFGLMRLPMKGDDVDIEQTKEMVDTFLVHGFNYFDTAHGYIDGKSEAAFKTCVADRFDRECYLITNKLTDPYFKKESDIRPFFEKQLKLCGVDYFDFYLMHAQNASNYEKFKKCRAYETAFDLKTEGKIRHVGLSFHDKAEVLDRILTDYPELEIVQIQLNYVDYRDASVDSKNVYEVCEKHGKPVIVMEPVKGGTLVNLPAEADKILRELDGGSNASYAVRYAADFPNVKMVLSGMSSTEQMKDNAATMESFRPLSDAERDAIDRVCDIIRSQDLIPCTSCRYCVEQNKCPMDILIPDMFALMNTRKNFASWNQSFYYNSAITKDGHGKASDCIECGMCEEACPQKLEIRELLKTVAKEFE